MRRQITSNFDQYPPARLHQRSVRWRSTWSDVLPQLGYNKPRQMSYIRCCNHNIGNSKSHGLRHQNHVTVNRFVTCCRLPLLTSLCPELCSLAYRNRSNWQILNAFHPLGRNGQPKDITEAVLFLADNSRSGWITGTILSVDGGVTAGRN